MSQIILKQVREDLFKNTVAIRPPVSYMTNKIVDEEKATEFGITVDSKLLLKPNTIINTEDKKAMFWLEYAKKLGVVVNSFEEGQAKPNAAYYIFKPEEAAIEEVSFVERKLDAYMKIKELSPVGKTELAKLLGFSPAMMTLSVLTKELYSIAETPPSKDAKRNYEKILEILDDKNYNYKLLIADVVLQGIVSLKNGNYYFNDNFIARDEAEFVEWLQASDNQRIVDDWKLELYKEVKANEVIVSSKGSNRKLK